MKSSCVFGAGTAIGVLCGSTGPSGAEFCLPRLIGDIGGARCRVQLSVHRSAWASPARYLAKQAGLLLRSDRPTPATLAELCNLQNPDWVDGGCGVAGFEEAALERVRLAQARLRAAQEADDAIEEAQAVEELEDAMRMARDHGVNTGDEGSP
ncbi:hypothetical protein E6U81_25345 [Streptomyces sp. A0592]|nr:hypothetical protein E6U81_25345 [Streptomyces sp. A0592]